MEHSNDRLNRFSCGSSNVEEVGIVGSRVSSPPQVLTRIKDDVRRLPFKGSQARFFVVFLSSIT